MPKPFLVLLVILTSSTSIYAQKGKETKQRDSSIIIFSESPRSTKISKKYSSGENNVIKISPLGFLKGCLPLSYERRISDLFTIQAGVGVTTRNYIRGLLYDAQNNDNSSNGSTVYTWKNNTGNQDISDEDELYNFDYRKPRLGYFVSLQPRLYFDSEAPDGSFLGVSFDHYQYNFKSPAIIGDGTNKRGNNWVNEYEKLNDIMVIFGYQVVYDHITLETTSGIGIRNIKGQKYAVGNNYSGAYTDGWADYKKTSLNFELGLKVGYHF